MPPCQNPRNKATGDSNPKMERIQQVFVLAGADCQEITDETEKVAILRGCKWGTNVSRRKSIRWNTRTSGTTGGENPRPKAMAQMEKQVEQAGTLVKEQSPTSTGAGVAFTFNPEAKVFVPAEVPFNFNPRAQEFRPTQATVHKPYSNSEAVNKRNRS